MATNKSARRQAPVVDPRASTFFAADDVKPHPQTASRLREERHRLDITPADAAILFGGTEDVWKLYESGKRPSDRVLLLLLGGGFDVNYILGGSRLAALLRREQELLLSFHEMDDEGRAAIVRCASIEVWRTQAGKQFAVQSAAATGAAFVVKRSKVGNVAGRNVTINAPAKKPKRP